MPTPYTDAHFPEGLPWLRIDQLPDILGNGPATSILARHVGLPATTSWTNQFAWRASVELGVVTDGHEIEELGGYGMATTGDPADYPTILHMKPVPHDDIPDLLSEILGEEIEEAVAEVMEAEVGSPNLCSIGVFASEDEHVRAAISFRRDARIKDETIDYIVDLIAIGGGDELSRAAVLVALQAQVISDIECLVHGIWNAGRPATIRTMIACSEDDLDDDIMGRIKELMDFSQDCCFGPDRDTAPEGMDWTLVRFERTCPRPHDDHEVDWSPSLLN